MFGPQIKMYSIVWMPGHTSLILKTQILLYASSDTRIYKVTSWLNYMAGEELGDAGSKDLVTNNEFFLDLEMQRKKV